uniref:protein-serine/threonine phosphatase n=1 Tax=Myotis myotis TaxID=51298 RepID=A0A7J7SD20_MYOMY|nr:putative protein phosphatase, Mg2+/Mn2+ dependent 1N (putative) [Myotis myotis]
MLLAWDPAPGEPEGVCGALRLAFWSADARLSSLWPRGEPRGSTAVVLLVSRRFLYLAHCGDSRAVLSRAGAVAFSTEGHRPLWLRERERIRALLCAQLLDTCLCKGSPDNRTCILVCFPGGPPGLARRKELELDAALGRRVAALCSSAQEPPSLNKVFRTLASEDIPDLPPGGGLYCMAAVIAEAYSQLFQAPGQRWVAQGTVGTGSGCGKSGREGSTVVRVAL